ncbi:PhzF family phenazine biosynthesis protein [Actinomadura madurae]|uniref:PhzF family phenazine biosynthesis protein n=1 Tax=Actinomadura madurae TaxID=1993 RepID=UPI00202677D0|nr:PhzF family phenazine biosynthesis protein [Actinomadura madurae]URN07544.1 PhzF family phenazine biosynthesis protein [Actinomadura madurae]
MPQDQTASGPVAYHHVDVFSDEPYAGNSLAVFVDPPPLTTAQMAAVTRELRHFETIFVTRRPDGPSADARVFDLNEELPFAGHPVLGAAAVLHDLDGTPDGADRGWTIHLPARPVRVATRRSAPGRLTALMDAGPPERVGTPAAEDAASIAERLGLSADDLDRRLPPQVWSTGLAYLIVPVRDGDAFVRARIASPDFENFLARRGAQFAYVLDASVPEGRHWNNDGVVEDVATGSAAGCVAAYLLHHGRAGDGVETPLAQGRLTGRPSTIAITAYGPAERPVRVTVGGGVAVVGTGRLHALPEPL